MKRQPIDPRDIRVGDLIRFEEAGTDYAYEWRQREYLRSESKVGTYFLLDRPKPAVELPTEPTLGWVRTAKKGGVLGVWYTNDRNPRPEQLLSHKVRSQRYRRDVLAFTPATAVPTGALNELRDGVLLWAHLDDNSILGKFLAAVDEAQA